MSDVGLPSYAPPARWVHWLTALAILAVIPLGLVMVRLDSGPTQDRLFGVHESIGFVILCLAVLRVAVRLANRPPPRPPGLPNWQWTSAQAVHHLLYLLIFAMPLLGWTGSSAFGASVSVFGLFTLPDLVPKDDRLADILGATHSNLGYVTAVLVVIHIGAGLYHGLVQQDGVLSRMLPGLSRR